MFQIINIINITLNNFDRFTFLEIDNWECTVNELFAILEKKFLEAV